MNREDTKRQVQNLLDQKSYTEETLKQIVFDYAKMEGLIPVSKEFSMFENWRKIVREDLGIEI